MGMKTSEVLGLGGEVLSFAESTSLEGTTFVPQKTTFFLDIPIPAGINKLFRVRVCIVAVNAAPITAAVIQEFTVLRDSGGGQQVPAPASVVSGSLVINYTIEPNALRFTFGSGYDGIYAWKWVLSPTFDVPFAIPAP
jgi:hypothetical protein